MLKSVGSSGVWRAFVIWGLRRRVHGIGHSAAPRFKPSVSNRCAAPFGNPVRGSAPFCVSGQPSDGLASAKQQVYCLLAIRCWAPDGFTGRLTIRSSRARIVMARI